MNDPNKEKCGEQNLDSCPASATVVYHLKQFSSFATQSELWNESYYR